MMILNLFLIIAAFFAALAPGETLPYFDDQGETHIVTYEGHWTGNCIGNITNPDTGVRMTFEIAPGHAITEYPTLSWPRLECSPDAGYLYVSSSTKKLAHVVYLPATLIWEGH